MLSVRCGQILTYSVPSNGELTCVNQRKVAVSEPSRGAVQCETHFVISAGVDQSLISNSVPLPLSPKDLSLQFTGVRCPIPG